LQILLSRSIHIKHIINFTERKVIMRQVILIPDHEEGGYTVTVPSLPGCISEGDTLAEALENIKEAIELHIESMIARGKEVPEDVGAPLQIATV